MYLLGIMINSVNERVFFVLLYKWVYFPSDQQLMMKNNLMVYGKKNFFFSLDFCIKSFFFEYISKIKYKKFFIEGHKPTNRM